MKLIKHSLSALIFLFIATAASAQWYHDDMGTTTFGSGPNPWINAATACNPPGTTNLGVTVAGPGGTGYTNWNGGWSGSGTGIAGASLTWQTDVGSPTTTSVSFTYSISVSGTATISSMTFGTRRNSVGHTNVAVAINGTPYTPTTTMMTTTTWTPNSVAVSPVRSYTAGQFITIVFTFTGGTGTGGVVQRLDELKIFGTTTPAPVEMTEFTVAPAPVGFDLQWRTATEKDNHYFAVERSPDGQSYSEIARVDGAGTSNTEQSYRYNDPEPLKGTNYYRLKQVDFDGRSDYSPIRLAEYRIGHEARISPNPLPLHQSPQLQLDMETEAILQVNVYDQLGQLLHTAQVNALKGPNLIPLDMAVDLPKGTYAVQILYEQQPLATQQLVIR